MGNLQAVGRDQPQPETLNQRLNSLGETLASASGRIESAISRVNGTPEGGEKACAIAPHQFSMTEMVARLEDQAKRLCGIADSIDRIA